jgi:DNA helicase-2/ATP-dependent DNA helicase PcrA
LENLKELMQALTEFESLAAFLEHVSLVMENDRGTADDMINLMTLHGAKGLEFDTVFLPGWEEGLFPNQRTLDEGAAAGLEEERRLAYVGLTRARRRCQVSFAANRRIFGQWQAAMPSRFIDELPAAHVTRNAQPGVYGAVGLADSGLGTFEYAAPWLGSERRAAMTRRDQTAPGRARANDAKAIGGLRVGARVFHQKFGYGRVTQIDDGKLTVAFDKAGEKRVIASYVALA